MQMFFHFIVKGTRGLFTFCAQAQGFPFGGRGTRYNNVTMCLKLLQQGYDWVPLIIIVPHYPKTANTKMPFIYTLHI